MSHMAGPGQSSFTHGLFFPHTSKIKNSKAALPSFFRQRAKMPVSSGEPLLPAAGGVVSRALRSQGPPITSETSACSWELPVPLSPAMHRIR